MVQTELPGAMLRGCNGAGGGAGKAGLAPRPVREIAGYDVCFAPFAPSVADESEGHYGDQAPLGGADGSEPVQHAWAEAFAVGVGSGGPVGRAHGAEHGREHQPAGKRAARGPRRAADLPHRGRRRAPGGLLLRPAVPVLPPRRLGVRVRRRHARPADRGGRRLGAARHLHLLRRRHLRRGRHLRHRVPAGGRHLAQPADLGAVRAARGGAAAGPVAGDHADQARRGACC